MKRRMNRILLTTRYTTIPGHCSKNTVMLYGAWSYPYSKYAIHLRLNMGALLRSFLDSIYLAGADLTGSAIERHAQCIEQSHKNAEAVRYGD